MSNFANNLDFISVFKSFPPKKQKLLLQIANASQLLALSECVLNFQNDKFPRHLSESELKKIKRKRRIFKKLCQSKTSSKQRRTLLQRGNGCLNLILDSISRSLGNES